MELTEKDAAIAYAKAWNTLNCSEYLQLLVGDCCYESQWVFSALEGKEAISEYFIGKLQTVKETRSTVRAELAVAAAGPHPDRNCVLLTQGTDEKVQVVVVFTVTDGKISRYDLCAPEMFMPQVTGVYPI